MTGAWDRIFKIAANPWVIESFPFHSFCPLLLLNAADRAKLSAADWAWRLFLTTVKPEEKFYFLQRNWENWREQRLLARILLCGRTGSPGYLPFIVPATTCTGFRRLRSGDFRRMRTGHLSAMRQDSFPDVRKSRVLRVLEARKPVEINQKIWRKRNAGWFQSFVKSFRGSWVTQYSIERQK